MRRFLNATCSATLAALTAGTVLALGFVLFFIVREALPAFVEVGVGELLLGTRWMPVDFGTGTSFGLLNFIAGTLLVSLLAMVVAVVVGLGAAVFLASCVSDAGRRLLYPFIDLLAGIPSVVYGFIGLVTLVPLFRKVGVSTGSCVLAASIVLAVMLLPYLVSSCADSLLRARRRYLPASDVLGVSPWHATAALVIPAAWRNVVLSFTLAIDRALGETMAVMMVVGNANLFPTPLGKGETIASLIALEMGTAVGGSTHYHALYAAGLVLLALVLLVQGVIALLRRRLVR